MTRVVVLGAGSVEFTRNIVADLCSYRELQAGASSGLSSGRRGPALLAEEASAYGGRQY